MNPYNSPWAKTSRNKSNRLWNNWMSIRRYLQKKKDIIPHEYNGVLAIDETSTTFYLAKNSIKFRIKSHLDWAWYTPQSIAAAIDNDDIEAYYEVMLANVNSDPNIWKDRDFEMELKSFYAARNNRASLL